MTDRLEQNLREAFSHRDAQLDGAAIKRLRANDYRPRRTRLRRPAIGATLGGVGLASIAVAIVALGSGAGPAFAGWQATPTIATPSEVTQAQQNCGQGLGAPIVTDSRGPYTAAVYQQSTTSAVCLSGAGVSMSSSSSSSTTKAAAIAPDVIQFGGGGMRDTSGDALTLSDGQVGSAVTAVTIDLSDGTSVQATVSNGWYLAWWPGDVRALDAQITTPSGTDTVTYPAAPDLSCPSGGKCSVGYGFSSGGGGQTVSRVASSGAANSN